MTKSEKEMFLAWLINEDARNEEDVKELQSRVRFRRVGFNDCTELQLALLRQELFHEFALIALRILHMD